ncbi:MAG: AfsR/SARP family transcriptional regulator [Actinobacteria bacterium]|nr:AfsR/SARP family transcriptional regulator [Actinomycetota bacterium]
MAEIGHRELGVLGPLFPAHITRPAQRRLLSVLLLHRGTDLDRDYLSECMWGDHPPLSARNALHVHISGLRSTIRVDIIATTVHGYRIDPDDAAFDVSVFERLAAAAHGQSDPAEQLRYTTSALELWRGNPYQELTDDTFAVPEVARLEERRLGLLELRMQAQLALGQHDEVIPRLRELVERFPLRERLHEHLMLALYRSGRQAEALRQFRSVCQVLGEQVGIEPGPVLRDLESRILMHDPGLGLEGLRCAHDDTPSFATGFIGRGGPVVATLEALHASQSESIVGVSGLDEGSLTLELGDTLLGECPGGFDSTRVARSFREDVDRNLLRLLPGDRELLDDIAVFNGWFGISDIVAVCAAGRAKAQLAAAMTRIVDSSLLLATRCINGSTRYRVLVSIREHLMASRRRSYGHAEEHYVRHYLSRALTWRGDRDMGAPHLGVVGDGAQEDLCRECR